MVREPLTTWSKGKEDSRMNGVCMLHSEKMRLLAIDLQLRPSCSDCVVPWNYICECNLLLCQISGSESVYDSLLHSYY